MSERVPRTISVRRGLVEPSGSWLYVWLDQTDGEIVYVGATGFDPELRAFLHATSESPGLGRVRAAVPRFDERDFTVLGFPLAPEVSRTAAKEALLARLNDLGWFAAREAPALPLQEIIDPIIDVIATERAGRSEAAGES